MLSVHLILIILAIIFSALAMVNASIPRINLIGAALFCFFLSLVV